MAILKKSQIKDMSISQLQAKLPELANELSAEVIAKTTAGKPSNPGRMRTIRKTIARIKTILTRRGAKELAALKVEPKKLHRKATPHKQAPKQIKTKVPKK